MKLKIVHLFPNELNLYGENGNIKALTFLLNESNIAYELININLEDKINFNEYDFIYIGSGRDIYLEKAKKVLSKYREEILSYLRQDKIFLVTGNALSIFDFLNLYEFTKLDNYQVGNTISTTSLCNGKIKGFQNTNYLIKSTDNLIFNLEKGMGNNNTMLEGYKYHNFYVTSQIGPILALNDNLNKYFVELLKGNKE